MIVLKKQNRKSTAVKAGIAGAVIGAAGAAIGMAMTDKKNRQKVKNSLTDAKKWTDTKLNGFTKETKKASDDVKGMAKEITEKPQSKANTK